MRVQPGGLAVSRAFGAGHAKLEKLNGTPGCATNPIALALTLTVILSLSLSLSLSRQGWLRHQRASGAERGTRRAHPYATQGSNPRLAHPAQVCYSHV